LKAAVRHEGEDGDLGAVGHGAEVVRDVLLRADEDCALSEAASEAGGRGQDEVEDLDGAAGREGVGVGVGVGREGACGERVSGLAVLGETADGLGMVVFFDGEIGAREAADGLALVIRDEDVDDGFARVNLEGGRGGLLG
jgi:hypothetical protein